MGRKRVSSEEVLEDYNADDDVKLVKSDILVTAAQSVEVVVDKVRTKIVPDKTKKHTNDSEKM